jgi:hypothetical protein
MFEALDKGDVKQSYYSAYLALAEYHFHDLKAEQRMSQIYDSEYLVSCVGDEAQLREAQQEVDSAQLIHAPKQTPSTLDPAAETPVPDAEPVKKPWEVASGDPTAVNFRPDSHLHAKMEWVCENVPKMSRLRILREGAELLCNTLIEKYYRH